HLAVHAGDGRPEERARARAVRVGERHRRAAAARREEIGRAPLACAERARGADEELAAYRRERRAELVVGIRLRLGEGLRRGGAGEVEDVDGPARHAAGPAGDLVARGAHGEQRAADGGERGTEIRVCIEHGRGERAHESPGRRIEEEDGPKVGPVARGAVGDPTTATAAPARSSSTARGFVSFRRCCPVRTSKTYAAPARVTVALSSASGTPTTSSPPPIASAVPN